MGEGGDFGIGNEEQARKGKRTWSVKACGMIRYLPRLLALAARVNLRHLKLFGMVVMASCLALMAGGGYVAWGWPGAILVPLVGSLVSLLFLHVTVRLAVSYGLRAHGRGSHSQAVRVLWLTQLPFLRLYDRRGQVSQAFHESKTVAAMELMTRLASSHFRL